MRVIGNIALPATDVVLTVRLLAGGGGGGERKRTDERATEIRSRTAMPTGNGIQEGVRIALQWKGNVKDT